MDAIFVTGLITVFLVLLWLMTKPRKKVKPKRFDHQNQIPPTVQSLESGVDPFPHNHEKKETQVLGILDREHRRHVGK